MGCHGSDYDGMQAINKDMLLPSSTSLSSVALQSLAYAYQHWFGDQARHYFTASHLMLCITSINVFVVIKQKRGPQRSVEIIVSAAFLLAIILVSILCIEVRFFDLIRLTCLLLYLILYMA